MAAKMSEPPGKRKENQSGPSEEPYTSAHTSTMSETRKPRYELLVKTAIQRLKSDLTSTMNEGVIDELYEARVIDDLQFEELKSSVNVGRPIKAIDDLLQMVLKADDKYVSSFMDVLQKSQVDDWTFTKIQEGIEKVKSGEWPLYGQPDIKGMKEMLVKKYTDAKWCDLEIIPDETSVTTTIEEQMLTPVFKVQKVKERELNSRGPIKKKKKVTDNDYTGLRAQSLGDILGEVTTVADTDLIDLQPNLVEMLGVAGTGKTTCVKQLAWFWAKGKCDSMNKYHLVFFIPVREIKKEGLIDLLCEMGLIPKSESENLCGWLQSPENACKVLFIIDGADENDIHKDKDLYDLVTGKLFSGVTVLVTARPEAKCLASFDRKPLVKVDLQGTDTDSRDRMLDKTVAEMKPEKIARFKKGYKEKLSDMGLLLVPLYLSLLCTVFREDLAEGLKYTSLRIPETMTMLFNSFMHVLIKRWLKRTMKEKYENIRLSFNHSPLDCDSNIPSHIQRTIYFIGKVCYEGLLKNKYEFSDEDARQNFLDMDDITNSGLFSTGCSKTGKIFFTKHKQLQEYLGALYLACEGTEERWFAKQILSEKAKGRPMVQVMNDCNLTKVVQFACGISGTFLESLLSRAISFFSVMMSSKGDTNVYYEASLFTEHHSDIQSTVNVTSLVGFSELKRFLYECEIIYVSREQIRQGHYSKCLHAIATLFNTDMCIDLLLKLYNIKLIPVASGDYHLHTRDLADREKGGTTGQSTSESELKVPLDQLQMELLGAVRVLGVESVQYEGFSRCYVDLPALLGTFPDLKQFDVRGNPYIPYCSHVRPDRQMGTSLTRVTLKSFLPTTPLPESHVTCLLQQAALTQLELYYVSILPVLGALTEAGQSLWPHLKVLMLSDDLSKLPESAVMTLTRLLESHADTLEECDLQVEGVERHSVPHIEQGLRSLRRVHTLVLEIRLSDRSYHTGEVLQHVLPHLTSLNILTVTYEQVERSITGVVDAVCSHDTLHTLGLQDGNECDHCDELPTQLIERLESRGVEVKYDRY